MNSQPTAHDLSLWQGYLEAERQYREAIKNLFINCYGPGSNNVLVEILRKDLGEFENRFVVLEVVEWLEDEYQQMLVDELLPLAARLETKRSINRAEVIISSWPREWLDANLEQYARGVMEQIAQGGYNFTDLAEFYSGLIGMFRDINLEKAKRLTEEAAGHTDPDVRSIGKSWLKDARW